MDKNKTIKFDELKPGDILLYEPDPSSTISMLVAKLTESTVTHAGMCYYTTDQVIDENEPKVEVIETKSRKGRPVHVMRFKNEEKNLIPVLDVAKNYLEKEEPFAMGPLVISGIVFLFKDITKSSPILQSIVLPLLELIVAEIIEAVDSIFNPGTKPMVCSQFVYVCYKEAGKEYKLHIASKKIVNSIFYNTLKEMHDYTMSNSNVNLELKMNVSKFTEEEKSDIINSVYDKLEKYSDNKFNDVISLEKIDLPFKKVIYNLFIEITKLIGFEKLELDDIDFIKKLKERLEAIEEYFVAPGSLFSECSDLNHKGLLDYQ